MVYIQLFYVFLHCVTNYIDTENVAFAFLSGKDYGNNCNNTVQVTYVRPYTAQDGNTINSFLCNNNNSGNYKDVPLSSRNIIAWHSPMFEYLGNIS